MSKVPEGYKRLCRTDEVKEGSGKRIIVDETDVAVYNMGGSFHAISNICPHQHASILHDGFLEDEYVTCPAHGWQFSCISGKMPEGRRGVDVYDVLIEDGIIYAKVFKKTLNW